LDEGLLRDLLPDLIITQGLCDVCAVSEEDVNAVIDRLPKKPVKINLEPTALGEVLETVAVVGRAAGVEEEAKRAIGQLKARIERVQERSLQVTKRPRVLFLEWIDPPYSAGHWDNELVEMAGGVECVGKAGQPSRRIEWDEIRQARPEVIFIACCGFDVDRASQDLPRLFASLESDEIPALQLGRVYICDGSQYFRRPGPRLVESLEILANALHPELHPLPESLCGIVASATGDCPVFDT
jgi:iron complex transport system substrate-binding protein